MTRNPTEATAHLMRDIEAGERSDHKRQRACTMERIANADHIAFMPNGHTEDAKQLRQSDPRLKHARIVNVLQMHPSKIEFGKVYPRP